MTLPNPYACKKKTMILIWDRLPKKKFKLIKPQNSITKEWEKFLSYSKVFKKWLRLPSSKIPRVRLLR